MGKRKKTAPPAYTALPTAADRPAGNGARKPGEDSVARMRDFGHDNQK